MPHAPGLWYDQPPRIVMATEALKSASYWVRLLIPSWKQPLLFFFCIEPERAFTAVVVFAPSEVVIFATHVCTSLRDTFDSVYPICVDAFSRIRFLPELFVKLYPFVRTQAWAIDALDCFRYGFDAPFAPFISTDFLHGVEVTLAVRIAEFKFAFVDFHVDFPFRFDIISERF